MQREMYKKNGQLSDEETKLLLPTGDHGILSINGDDGYPYAVPINYVYLNGAIYMHSAKYGYKIDVIKENSKACFTVILDSEVLPNKFTTKFKSIISFGKVTIVDNDDEKYNALEEIINRFSPDFKEGGLKLIKGSFSKTEILKFSIEEIKGKSSSH